MIKIHLVQAVQNVQPLRSVQSPTCFLPRVAGEDRWKNGLNIRDGLNNLNDLNGLNKSFYLSCAAEYFPVAVADGLVSLPYIENIRRTHVLAFEELPFR